jgi:RHS repeat-associated protein
VNDSKRFLNGGLVSIVSNTFDDAAQSVPGGTIHFVRVRQTVEVTYELPGQGAANENLITSVTTDNTYDDFGNPLTITLVTTDAAGNQFTKLTTNTYDNDIPHWYLGRLKTAQVTSRTPADPTGLTRLSSFDYYPATGLLFHEAIESNSPTGPPDSPLKSVTTHEYDAFGNKTRVVTTAYKGYDGSAGTETRQTSSVYDARGQFPLSTTNALAHTETYTYDARFGTVKTLTGPNGLTTTWDYDGFGRKIKETRADNTQTTWEFAWCGNSCQFGGYQTITRVTGAPPTVLYEDKLGREVRTETVGFNGAPIYKDTEYNSLGQVSRASRNYFSNATPQWTYFHYDGLERLIKQQTPDGSITHFVQQGLKQTLVQTNNTALTVTASSIPASSRTDSLGSAQYTLVTVRENNALGKLTKVTDPDLNTTLYQYDVFENLTRVTDANNNVTVMAYDLRGRKTSMDDPDMGHWEYRYNGFGELVWQRDAKLQVTAIQYDALGRMTQRTDLADTPEAVTDFWTYDTAEHGLGKPDTVLGGDGYVRSHHYDTLGRPTRIDTLIAGEAYRQDTTYDGYGRIDTTIYPTGFAVRNTYTPLGYRDTVINAANPGVVYWTGEAVNADGRIAQERLGNNLTTVNSYDPASGHLDSITTGAGAASDVQNLAYTFDPLGNLLQRRDQVDGNNPLTEDFTYDKLNRLKTGNLQGIGPSGSYDYDAVGNLQSKSGFATQYIYGENNAGPHAVTTVKNGSSVVASYQYDANGNMISGAGRSLAYTAFNLPTRITKNAKHTDFEYDPDRARTRQINEQGTLVYLNPRIDLGNHYEKETHADGSVEHKHYIYGAGGPIAIHTERSNAAPDIKYLHKDHLGSTDVITDATGNVLQRLSFSAFGERRAAWTLPLPAGFIAINHHGFTGHEHLDDLGLVHMNGRLYDPQLGRFLQADPTIQFPESTQGFNRYTYAGNNPLSYTDPSGYSWLSKLWKKIKKWVKVIIAVVVAIYTFGAVAGFLNGLFIWGGTVTAGIIGGAAAGFVSGLILSGGDLRVAFSSALGGAITGGVAGAFGNTWSLARVGATSVAGGVSSEVTGGSFKDGFRFALAVSLTTYTALRMRQEMIEQSKLDSRNASGKSVGFKGDKFKLGGGRFDFDRPGIPSPLGGEQGGQGSLFGVAYQPGSWQDRLIEAYSGPHDILNSAYWYDRVGNIQQSMTPFARVIGEVINAANVILATPFVSASVVPEYAYPALEHIHSDRR